MPTTRTTAGVAGLIALVAAAASFAQTPQPAQEPLHLSAAAGDEILWLVIGEDDPKEKVPVNRLAYLDASSSTIHASPVIPQLGKVARLAVLKEVLHVFFTDGIHQHYSTARPARRGVRLPGGAVPEAVTGGTHDGMPVLWAVVGGDTADAVARDWAETQRRAASQPGAEAPATQPETQPALGPRLQGGYALVIYDGDEWQPGMAAPDAAAHAQRLWLCTSPGRQHLFWEKTRASATIHYAWYENGNWTDGPALSLPQPPVEAAVQIANTELAFAALLPASEGLRVSCWRRPAAAETSTTWTESAEFRTNDNKPLLLPRGTALAIFGSSLAVLRERNAAPELGLWSVARGGQAEGPFREVTLRRHTGEPSTPPALREFTTTIIIAFILLLVFWRRQSSFAVPVALPPGLAIARPAKRALAAVIDMLPAMLFVYWWWHGPLSAFAAELQAASNDAKTLGTMPHVAVPETVIWAGVTFRALYTVYCTIFELWLSATPGKRLMGCYVLSESLTRPSWLQIVIRNFSRVVELEPYLVIWPFLLVIFFTRNRQRVGDLLARTVVVDRAARYTPTPGADD